MNTPRLESPVNATGPGLLDTHCHLVDLQRLRYPWLQQVPALQRNFSFDDYRAQAQAGGVTAAIYMEVDVAEDLMLEEVAFAASLGAPLAGIIAACRPESAGFAAYLDSVSAEPLVKGLRRVLHTAPDGLAEQALFVANLRLLARHGLSFDLCVRQDQLPIALALARACPDVQFVLDHCGNPEISTGALASWRAGLNSLAALPNVACKISGIVTHADPQHWRVADLRPVFEHVIACFGWSRVVWGSDWPVCTVAAPLGRWVDATRELVSGASPSEVERLFGANARRIYRLDWLP